MNVFAPDGAPTQKTRRLVIQLLADFLADATKYKLDVEPRDGAYLADIIRKVYATPKSVVERVSALTK